MMDGVELQILWSKVIGIVSEQERILQDVVDTRKREMAPDDEVFMITPGGGA